jgi:hypothetical protein
MHGRSAARCASARLREAAPGVTRAPPQIRRGLKLVLRR